MEADLDTAGLVCAGCGLAAPRLVFRFQTDAGPILKCLGCSLRHRPLVINALRTAAVVGTALTAINQGDVVLGGTLSAGVAGKIGLTYIVPYLVSTYSALAISRVRPAAPDRAMPDKP